MPASTQESANSDPLNARIATVHEATRAISRQFPRSYILDCIKADRFPEEMWRAMGKQGLLGLSVPEEHGGSGGGVVEIVALGEALALGGCRRCSWWSQDLAEYRSFATARLNKSQGSSPQPATVR